MSIGIYKIKNTINNKCYIGQSVDIEKRFYMHKHFYHKDSYIDQEIHLQGLENFEFSIIELCEKDELDQKEIYYIENYNSFYPNGYNLTKGGQTYDGKCLTSSFTEEEVRFIRTCYRDQTYSSAAEIQRLFFPDKDRHAVAKIYNGQERLEIMPEVYIENYFYSPTDSYQNGEHNASSKLKEYDVLKMRVMYSIMPRNNIIEYYQDKYSERAIVSIISGQNWKYLPLYKKREKRWLFPDNWTALQIEDFKIWKELILNEFK